MLCNFQALFLLAAATALFMARPTHAATGTWTGGAGATWNTSAANWSGVSGTPWDSGNGPTNIATFNTGGATPNVGGTVYCSGITFSSTATISGGTITLAGAAPTISNTAAGTITATIAGAIALTKSGTGTLTFSGTNTYTGATTISGGTLALGTSGSITNSPNVTIGSGATFDLSAAGMSMGDGMAVICSAAGTNAPATLKVAGGKNLTLGTGGMVFTNYTGGSSNAFTLAGAAGSLALNSGPVTVYTVSPLAAGIYMLVGTNGAATVTGTPGVLLMAGGSNAPGTAASLLVMNNQLLLIVETPGPPILDNGTGAAPGIGWAALNGSVVSTGTVPATVYTYWGDSDGDTNKDSWTGVITNGVLDIGSFSGIASNLIYGVRYYYRCYGSNDYGDAWAASTVNFTTLRPVGSLVGTGGNMSSMAAGGTNYIRCVFTNSGTFNVMMPGVADILVVGGGGPGGPAGSAGGGGGGGAGGLVYSNAFPLSAASYTVTVGAGGTCDLGTGQTAQGTNGSPSVFGTITALGGGRGGKANYGMTPGSGGSGGGGHSDNGTPGSGTAGQGNNGGNGSGGSGGKWVGGGGGGAGAVGGGWQATVGGAGGNGLNYSSRFGTDVGVAGWFAGGGGGNAQGGATTSSGGAGGGGAGGCTTSDGIAGTANTGSGGGAAGSGRNAGYGGSGVVILRYAVPAAWMVNASASGLTFTSAVLNATLACSNATFGVTAFWNTTSGGTNAEAWTNSAYVGSWTNVAATNLTCLVTGLTPGTQYYFTFCGTNAAGATWATNVLSFTTYTSIGVDNDGGATNVVPGVASLRGGVTGSPADVVRIYWGTTDGGTSGPWEYTNVLTGVGRGPFSSNASNLMYGVRYYYRCYATNAWGDAWAPASTNFLSMYPAGTTAYLNYDGGGTKPTGAAIFGSAGDQWNQSAGGNGWQNLAAWSLASLIDVNGNTIPGASLVLSEAGNPNQDAARLINNKYPSSLPAPFDSSIGDGAGAGTITWTVSGLSQATLYNVYVYWGYDATAGGTAWVNTSATQTFTYAAAQSSPVNGRDYRLFTSIAAAGGAISVNAPAVDSNAGIAGFQIVKFVPAPSITNLAATPLTLTSAMMNGRLACPGAVYDVTVFWNTSDGGTNEAAWTNSAYVGSWTNTFSTNISCLATGLVSGTQYYFTFRGTNVVDTIWAQPSMLFQAAGPPIVTNAGAVSCGGCARLGAGVVFTGGAPTTVYAYWGAGDGSTNKTGWDTVVTNGVLSEGTFWTDTPATLLTGTQYFYRVYATNMYGEAWAPSTGSFLGGPLQNIAGGNWSAGKCWLGGIAPAAGGSPYYAILYNTNSYTGVSTNDLPNFLLNQLSFGTNQAGVTLTGQNLAFTNNGTELPQVTQSGSNSVVLGNLNLTTNTTFTGPGTGAVSVAGAITGSGGLTKAGAGKLTLTGANNYSGATTITNGTLSVGNGGAGASIGSTSGITLTNNANITFNHSDNVTFSRVISGAGSLTKSGTGKLTLNIACTYTGTTTVNAGGTLSINGNQYLPSIGPWIVNGTLSYDTGYGGNNMPGSVTLNNGTLGGGTGCYDLGAFIGGGTTIFANGTTNTLSALYVGINSSGLTLSTPLVTDTLNVSGKFGATNNMVGVLTKNGLGTVTLTGTSTYTNSTVISAGTLKLGASGSITNSASMTIGSGATLDVSAKASFTMPAGQTFTFNIDPSGSGSAGLLKASGLEIGLGRVVFDCAGPLDDPAYVIATYTSLTGSCFAQVMGPSYLDYHYIGSQIALVRGTLMTVR